MMCMKKKECSYHFLKKKVHKIQHTKLNMILGTPNMNSDQEMKLFLPKLQKVIFCW